MTIGHSTRSLEDLIELLKAYGVETIVDVRTVPRSWHVPQFNSESLPKNLMDARIGYVHMSGLGGLRHARRDSINLGWRNASFRGYADYMQTPEFESNLQELIGLAEKSCVALMCAESVPWRCHRLLISDALVVRGFQVEHIMNSAKILVHTLTRWAKVEGTRLTYPLIEDETSLGQKCQR
jgi:uncharacterized protein (DUF488 family)